MNNVLEAPTYSREIAFESAISELERNKDFRRKELHLFCEIILNVYIGGDWLSSAKICGIKNLLNLQPNIEMGFAKILGNKVNHNTRVRMKKKKRLENFKTINMDDFYLKYACQIFEYGRYDLYTNLPFQYIYSADDEKYFRYYNSYLGRMSKMLHPMLPSPDHIIPIAKGGLNNIDNIVFVTRYLNVHKSDDTLHFYCLANVTLDKDIILSRIERVNATYHAAKEDEKLRNTILEQQRLTSPFLDIERKLLKYINTPLISDDLGY